MLNGGWILVYKIPELRVVESKIVEDKMRIFSKEVVAIANTVLCMNKNKVVSACTLIQAGEKQQCLDGQAPYVCRRA